MRSMLADLHAARRGYNLHLSSLPSFSPSILQSLV